MKKATPGNTKKRPYLLPTITKLNLGQAKQFVAGHAQRNDQQAMDLLDSLRREQQQKEN
jgi:hypothetical protein